MALPFLSEESFRRSPVFHGHIHTLTSHFCCARSQRTCKGLNGQTAVLIRLLYLWRYYTGVY
jgi:hypothetical protein